MRGEPGTFFLFSLLFYDFFEIRFGMLADGTDEIIGKFLSLPLISADAAAPDGLALGSGVHRLGFRFDGILVVFVGAGRVFRQNGHEEWFTYKESV